MNEQEVLEIVQKTAPTCLNDCCLFEDKLSTPLDSNPCSIWTIACRCGGKTGQFLGYSLKDYSKNYTGAECFLSPLAFECKECKKITEILDTDLHGYHSELARRSGDDIGSGKLRGEGPRKAFACTKCTGTHFKVTVAFVFWYLDELAEEFDASWEELFNVFLCECRCLHCGEVSKPTDFGKL